MFQKIDPKKLDLNAFSAFQDRWMLVTAGTPEHCNTMTAGWGGLGILWRKPTATIYVRPQRYTSEFLDESDCFTLSFFPEQYREQLNYCGAKSGRDTDKIKDCGFTVCAGEGNAPYFGEADLVLVCRKTMRMPMDPSAVPEEARKNFYQGPEQGYHLIYWGEITEVLQKV